MAGLAISPDGSSTRMLRRAVAGGGSALLLGYVPMARWERRMRATGGPGIVGLQLAPDAQAAREILATWGAVGRRAASEQTWADFAWMQTYALTGACLVELARRRTAAGSGWDRAGRVVRVLPHVAMALDVVEGIGQLRTLRSWEEPGERVVATTRAAATGKYALLAAAALWAVAAATAGAGEPAALRTDDG